MTSEQSSPTLVEIDGQWLWVWPDGCTLHRIAGGEDDPPQDGGGDPPADNADDQPDDQPADDDADDSDADFDKDRAMNTIRKLRAAEKDWKKQQKELEQLRADKAKRDAADKKRKDADMSELERVRQEKADLEQQIAERDARLRTSALRAAVASAAAKEGFNDPDDAWSMMAHEGGLDGLDMDDNGKVTGAAEAVKALAKAKPYLKKAAQGTNINSDNGRGDGKPPPDPKKIEEMAAQRFGVRPPS